MRVRGPAVEGSRRGTIGALGAARVRAGDKDLHAIDREAYQRYLAASNELKNEGEKNDKSASSERASVSGARSSAPYQRDRGPPLDVEEWLSGRLHGTPPPPAAATAAAAHGRI